MTLIETIRTELEAIGLKPTFTTLPELWSWLRKVKLLYIPPKLILDESRDVWSTPGGIEYDEFHEAMKDTFGKVYLSYRTLPTDSEGTYCFIKTCENHNASFLLEGILQTIARCAVEQHGLRGVIPRVLDILKHPTLGIVLALERIPNSKLFGEILKTDFLWNTPSLSNDILVFGVLAQLATYIAILEFDLGMNHRDLKGSNVLMIVPDESYRSTVQVGPFQWTVAGNYRCILIDFGFACMGKQTGETVISAGNYLPQIDFCPKEGRDLFLFFASLWAIPAFRASLTETGQSLFTKWLRDLSPTLWSQWLTGPESEKEKLESMYLLTGASSFRSNPSDPIQVLRDIASAYPQLAQITTTQRPPTPRPNEF